MSDLQKLKNKLDKVFSMYIRKRDANGEYFKCISCGKIKSVSQMHAGHFMSRRHLTTRYNEQNVNGQCNYCNTYDQGQQHAHGKAIDKKYGEGTADKLYTLAHTKSKLTQMWYLNAIIQYKEKLKGF